ncbi:hypothetical protein MMC07_004140 [Pseudocyphellaria aurata]|nr:hypothetical protein [Pseudocyphellaria aurata]
MDPLSGKTPIKDVTTTEVEESSLRTSTPQHAAPEPAGTEGHDGALPSEEATTVDEIEEKKKGRFAYLKTRNFYIVLGLGQVLALALTATNTFSTLLVNEGTSIPSFQNLFNYILLTLIYTSYTIYSYGFKKWFRMLATDGWKYFILSFFDVQGNYFTVLAYRYTTILSAQLINFWAIVLVVLLSSTLLRVRYHPAQIVGIVVCIGGMGILLGSDHITGSSNYGPVSRGNQLKGDLFALLGATFYGMSNLTEEFLVSKRPLYEVVGQMGFWGMLIIGTQAGIFDRDSFRTATWNGPVGGYLVGFTLCLTLFYSVAPLVFRLASAAYFNISLLTTNFWGVVIGVRVFGYHVHWMYPIAFVCIVGGLVIYNVGKQVLGEARKPWLGKNQEDGVSGIGTAKRRAERGDRVLV